MAYGFGLVSILCPFLNLYISKMNINLINSRGQLHGPQRSMTAQTIDGQRDFIRAISNKKLRNMLVEQDQRARIGGNLGVYIKLWFITAIISVGILNMVHSLGYGIFVVLKVWVYCGMTHTVRVGCVSSLNRNSIWALYFGGLLLALDCWWRFSVNIKCFMQDFPF